MEPIYDAMLHRQALLVPRAHPGVVTDPSTCLAIYAPLEDVEMTEAFRELQTRCQAFFPYTMEGGVNQGRLHVTLLQLLTFGQFRPDQDTLAPYASLLEELLPELLPLTVEFQHVCVAATSVMMLGFPDKDVNAWRERFRRRCLEAKVPLHEPYKADLVHCTLARFATVPTPKQLAGLACRSVVLGRVRIHRWLVGPATWRVGDSPVWAEFNSNAISSTQ